MGLFTEIRKYSFSYCKIPSLCSPEERRPVAWYIKDKYKGLVNPSLWYAGSRGNRNVFISVYKISGTR